MVKLQNSKSAKSIKSVETLGDLKKKLNPKSKSIKKLDVDPIVLSKPLVIKKSKTKDEESSLIAIKKSELIVNVGQPVIKSLKKKKFPPKKVEKEKKVKKSKSPEVSKKLAISDSEQKRQDERALFGSDSLSAKDDKVPEKATNKTPEKVSEKKKISAPPLDKNKNKFRIGPASSYSIPSSKSKEKTQTLKIEPQFENMAMIRNLTDIQLYQQLQCDEDRAKIKKVLERFEIEKAEAKLKKGKEKKLNSSKSPDKSGEVKLKQENIDKQVVKDMTVRDQASKLKTQKRSSKSLTPIKILKNQSRNSKSAKKTQSKEKMSLDQKKDISPQKKRDMKQNSKKK